MERMQQEITGKVTVTPKEIRKYFNGIPTDSLPYFSSEVELGQIVKYATISKSQKQAAREQLEELRKRLGEPNRPQEELDYYERLLRD